MQDVSVACRIVKGGVRRAAAHGDTESLFLDTSFIRSSLPGAQRCRDDKIARRVEEAEARRDEIEATVDWFRQEVAVIKAAEIAALRRYFQWRMDRDGDRPRTLRQYTDERTGGVAWEAFEQDMLVLRCKFFRSRRYRFPDCLRGDAWEETLRKVLRSRR